MSSYYVIIMLLVLQATAANCVHSHLWHRGAVIFQLPHGKLRRELGIQNHLSTRWESQKHEPLYNDHSSYLPAGSAMSMCEHVRTLHFGLRCNIRGKGLFRANGSWRRLGVKNSLAWCLSLFSSNSSPFLLFWLHQNKHRGLALHISPLSCGFRSAK